MGPYMARANDTGFFQESDWFFIGAEGGEGIFSLFYLPHDNLLVPQHFQVVFDHSCAFLLPIGVFLVPTSQPGPTPGQVMALQDLLATPRCSHTSISSSSLCGLTCLPPFLLTMVCHSFIHSPVPAIPPAATPAPASSPQLPHLTPPVQVPSSPPPCPRHCPSHRTSGGTPALPPQPWQECVGVWVILPRS